MSDASAPPARLLAFSDLHRDADAAAAIVALSDGVDVAIGAGDFGTRGEGGAALLERLEALACPLILVAGNHDRLAELRTFCAGRPDRHLLDGETIEVAGLRFFGLGGEIPSRSDAIWNETSSEDEARAVLRAAPAIDVLVTHTPPYGHCDEQSDGRHEGSVAIAEAVDARRPALCLCGHIHHAWGRIARVGPTTVHNLGPIPVRYTLPVNR